MPCAECGGNLYYRNALMKGNDVTNYVYAECVGKIKRRGYCRVKGSNETRWRVEYESEPCGWKSTVNAPPVKKQKKGFSLTPKEKTGEAPPTDKEHTDFDARRGRRSGGRLTLAMFRRGH